MTSRRPALFVLVTALLLASVASVVWWRRDRGTPPAEVAIQDGKTIDFSSGRPVVKDDAREKALIDAAVKEMEAATQGVTFEPTTPAAK